jgi:hypothetical protein
MRDVLLILLHLAVLAAKLCGPGGVRAVIAENLVIKQQLMVLRRVGPTTQMTDRRKTAHVGTGLSHDGGRNAHARDFIKGILEKPLVSRRLSLFWGYAAFFFSASAFFLAAQYFFIRRPTALRAAADHPDRLRFGSMSLARAGDTAGVAFDRPGLF